MRQLRAPDGAGTAVRVAAGAATDLGSLAVAARTCTACPELAASRRTVVVGSTPPGARLLLLGEAPGAHEDETGLPFVGRSGQLLDRLLGELGGDRAQVAVLNTLKCRPPANRPPKPAESARCRGWTERQLALAAPSVVVALGLSAARWFLGATPLRTAPLGAVRGRVHEVAGTQVVPTYHPSAAIRHGPRGHPSRLLREDLALALRLAQE